MNEIRHSLEQLPEADAGAQVALTGRAAGILRPAGALARLDELAVWIGSWQGHVTPHVDRPAAVLFAADHGVASDGVSAYPAEVTAAMLDAFRAGRSTLDAMARRVGASVAVHDVGVGRPTANLRLVPAMTREGMEAAFRVGRAAVQALGPAVDLLVVGEMGIGNTTSAAALCARLLGGEPDGWVGRGTGVDDRRLQHKQDVVTEACTRTADVDDPLEIFRHLGGHELAAMAGAYVQARHRRLPVLLDGFVATAAIVPLWCVEPSILDHCRAGHRSAERAHAQLLARLGLTPLLDLALRLGEGSGALAAVPLVAMACSALVEVPTFHEWFGAEQS